MQNVNFVKMGVELAERLKNDGDIKNFCQDTFGKDVSILVGDPTDRLLPTEEDAPYIFCGASKRKKAPRLKTLQNTSAISAVVSAKRTTAKPTAALLLLAALSA